MQSMHPAEHRKEKAMSASEQTNLLLMPVAEPPAEYHFKGAGYQLRADFYYKGGGHEVWVPSRFIFDGASIPEIGWSKISTPFNPKIMHAAVVHDWVYYNHQMSRKEADRLFVEMMKESGFDWGKRVVVQGVLSAFGGAFWKNSAQDVKFLKHLWNIHPGPDKTRYRFPTEAQVVIANAKTTSLGKLG